MPLQTTDSQANYSPNLLCCPSLACGGLRTPVTKCSASCRACGGAGQPDDGSGGRSRRSDAVATRLEREKSSSQRAPARAPSSDCLAVSFAVVCRRQRAFTARTKVCLPSPTSGFASFLILTTLALPRSLAVLVWALIWTATLLHTLRALPPSSSRPRRYTYSPNEPLAIS